MAIPRKTTRSDTTGLNTTTHASVSGPGYTAAALAARVADPFLRLHELDAFAAPDHLPSTRHTAGWACRAQAGAGRAQRGASAGPRPPPGPALDCSQRQ